VLPHVKAGRLVALGVSGSQRSPTLPEVPTLAEAGVAGYEANFTLVMYAPKGTPTSLVERFRAAFVEAIRTPEVGDKLRVGDQHVVGSTPEQAAQQLAADSRKWGEVARRIKLGLD
jgi:tripartite-type tricarboxylate transporter receptor subunit TctC